MLEKTGRCHSLENRQIPTATRIFGTFKEKYFLKKCSPALQPQGIEPIFK
ncbi:hypothetical protein [Anoxybacillus flavithermus]|nr:hypothetical protein [Anoxybacillus flavithermus]MBE2930801.1 hypothetical protein [Anoxybacillus flavithermus]MBE2957823.1 hypothetical protein [Anoxybacillus flavithermus]